MPNVFQRYPERVEISPDSPTAELEFAVQGVTDVTTAYNLVALVIPPTYLGLWLEKLAPEFRGGDFWDFKAQYTKTRPLIAGGGVVFTAETSGKTIHREQSLETVLSRAAANISGSLGVSGSTPAPDMHGLIGVDPQNGTVQGVDVEAPTFRFTVSKKFVAAGLPANFLQTLADLTPSTNNGPFTVIWKGQVMLFDTGEVLYRGVQISDGGVDGLTGLGELIEVHFSFEAQQNRTVNLGGTTNPAFQAIPIKGHESFWVLRQTVVDQQTLVQQPSNIYVERVYESADFGQFLL